MTESMIYWITRLDHIHTICDCIVLMSSLCAVAIGCVLLVSYIGKAITAKYNRVDHVDDDYEMMSALFNRMKKPCLIAFAVMSCIMLVDAFIPTTAEMAAVKVIPKITAISDLSAPHACEKLKSLSNKLCNEAAKWLNSINKSK